MRFAVSRVSLVGRVTRFGFSNDIIGVSGFAKLIGEHGDEFGLDASRGNSFRSALINKLIRGYRRTQFLTIEV